MKQLYLKRNLFLWVLTLLFLTYSHAQVPNYYNGTDITANGESLKSNLATLVTNSQTTILSYTPGVWEALKQTDLDPTNSNNVLLIYGYNDTDSDVTNDRTRSKDQNSGDVGDWNREHTYPKSLGNPNLGETGPGSDAHHLRASDVQLNGVRSNRKYIDADGNARVVDTGFYPGDEWKGDVARMMMYMYIRYGDRCLPNAVGLGNSTYSLEMRDIFLEWNAEDPVSQVEINRNVLLEGIQGNRNPFIDNPAFATTIWGGPQAENRFENGTTDFEAPSIPANLIASNTTATETFLTWDTATDNIGVIAYQIFNGATLVTSTSGINYEVTGLTPNTEYIFTVIAVDAAGNTSDVSNTATITTLEDVIVTPPTGDYIVFQGYEGTATDTWSYTQSPISCNDGGDVWDVVASVGSISAPKTGVSFFGVQDLEGNCGTADGGTLSFNAIDITGYKDVVLSFGVNVVGFDVANGDVITYEIFHDEVSQGVTTITVDSPYSTADWEVISNAIPNNVSNVRMVLFVKQNGGSDYAGFDDVQLQGTAIGGTPSIVINEVDADTPGTDALEFIELYDGGVGNSSLDGLVVVLYNGSNNLSYNAIDLDGYTTNENGYFVIGSALVANVDLAAFTTNGIQNGADAAALYTGDDTNFPSGTAVVVDETLLDALVYDTNDSDDLDLLILLNSGEAQVNEDGMGDKDNHSMQRIPNGQGGARNTDTYAMLIPSPGTENSAGGVIDNEVPTVPTNIVAVNTTSTSTDLSWDAATDNIAVTEYQIFEGTTLVGSTSNTSFTVESLVPNTSYTFIIVAVDAAGNVSENSNTASITTLEDVIVTPPTGDVIVFQGYEGNVSDTWAYTQSPISCNDGGGDVWDVVSIVGSIGAPKTGASFFGVQDLEGNCGTADGGTLSFDAIDITGYQDVVLSFGVNVVGFDVANGDVITYEIFHDEVSQGVTTITVVDSGAYSTTGWEVISQAIPNSVSSVRMVLFVKQNGASDYAGFDDVQLQGAAIGGTLSIVINEVDADTPGTDALEFIELYDGGIGNTSLDGLVVVFYNGSDNLSYNSAIDLDGYTTNENGYFVIGSALVANVDLVAFTTNGIQNGADAVALYQGEAINFPNDTPILLNDTLLDALVYDTDDSDDTELLVLLNSGQEQINEAGMGDKDNHSMQRMPNGSGGARNTASYTQAIPSPGTENGAVIPPPAVISILAARNTAEGEVVTVSGMLTVSDQFAGSAYIQDATAAIAIFDQTIHGEGNFMIGDSITLTGTRSAFNDQIQISTVTQVENNGLPTNAIAPLTITLAEMGNHPAELVQILNPAYPKPGDILFGNSNYTLTDASGNGELRIDNDVASIVGLGQPESCDEIVGVVGRFYETYQLLPRMKSDMACAVKYIPLGSAVTVSKDKTFDVVAWNIEWFGDETNSPAAGNPLADAIQKDSVKTVLQKLNADVYAVEEISDDVLFAQMVSEMPGYNYVLSEAVSYPNDETGTQQKVGFIYNTETVLVINTKPLLASIHPYYNGGDDSALTDYPVADKTRFYASGRLPFMMTADVTLEGVTKQFNMVALHARANGSSDSQLRYDMRKYDVEVLKDTLDAQYAGANLIVLGDYNDDIDVTVADNVSSTVSTFEKYVSDPTNYTIVTSTLSAGDYRSYVFRENMIDHIMVSNEVAPIYIEESVSVGYEFYDADFTSTASDHFPVAARFLLNELTLNEITATNVTCAGEQNGTASVSVSGGITPYTYVWSDGQTAESATGLVGGMYTVFVTDALGKMVTGEVTITEAAALEFTQTEDTTVYFGYEAQSCTTLEISSVLGGVAPYSYTWSTGETSQSITACPEETTSYSVTITDANGCTAETIINVEVIDVSCGNSRRHPKVEICHKGRTICVSKYAVQYHLNHGDSLGSCDGGSDGGDDTLTFTVYPNPFVSYIIIELDTPVKANAAYLIYDHNGRLVHRSHDRLAVGKNKSVLPLWYLRRGYYYLKTFVDGELQGTQRIVKK